MATDSHIQEDLMTALATFADAPLEIQYWNGFAIYCMEIAAGFIQAYNDELGTIPPGITQAELERKQRESTTTLTRAAIKSFAKGTAVHPDVAAFLAHFRGHKHTAITKAEADKKKAEDDAAKALREALEARRARTQLERSIDGKLTAIQTALAGVSAAQARELAGLQTSVAGLSTAQTRKLDQLEAETRAITAAVAEMERKRAEVTARFMTELGALKTAATERETRSSIDRLMQMFAGSESVDSASSGAQRQAARIGALEAEKGRQDARITQLEAEKGRHEARIAELQAEVGKLQADLAAARAAPGPAGPAGASGAGPAGASGAGRGGGSLSTAAAGFLADYAALCQETGEAECGQAFAKTVDYSEFDSLGQDNRKNIETVMNFVRRFKPLLWCLETFLSKYPSSRTVIIVSELSKKLKKWNQKKDQIVMDMLYSVLGFGRQEAAFSYVRSRNAATGLEVIKSPFLAVKTQRRGGNVEQYIVQIDTSEVPSLNECKNFTNFEMLVADYRKCADSCFIFHLFCLLVLALQGNTVAADQLDNYIIPIVCTRLNIDVSGLQALLTKYSAIVGSVAVRTPPVAKFPYFLVHEGMYCQELMQTVDQYKPLLVSVSDQNTNKLFSELSTGIVQYLQVFPDMSTADFLDDFGPVI